MFKQLANALIRLHVCAGWSEPLIVAHTTLSDISRCSSNVKICLKDKFSYSHRIDSNRKRYKQSTNLDQTSIVDCHLLLLWRQMPIKNTVSNNLSTFLDSIGVFDCRLPGVIVETNFHSYIELKK